MNELCTRIDIFVVLYLFATSVIYWLAQLRQSCVRHSSYPSFHHSKGCSCQDGVHRKILKSFLLLNCFYSVCSSITTTLLWQTSLMLDIAVVRLAEPIALTSIFPYAFPLVKKFNITDDSNASFYAGLLISAFALAEATTGMFWGGLSDRIGRKPVLLAGCFGTFFSSNVSRIL